MALAMAAARARAVRAACACTDGHQGLLLAEIEQGSVTEARRQRVISVVAHGVERGSTRESE